MMKKTTFLILFLLFCSCSSTELIYDKRNSDLDQIRLIERILKHPEIIKNFCDDSVIVDDHFKKVLCSQLYQKWLINYIKNNFSGVNKVIGIKIYENLEIVEIINIRTNQDIYFKFNLEEGKKKLTHIHGNIEL